MKIRNYMRVAVYLILLTIPTFIYSQDLRFPASPNEQLLNNNRYRHAAMTENRLPASWNAFGIYKPTELVGDVEIAWVKNYASELAAGASAEAGGPLMDTFIHSASDIAETPSGLKYKEHFDRVSEALENLDVVGSKTALNFS